MPSRRRLVLRSRRGRRLSGREAPAWSVWCLQPPSFTKESRDGHAVSVSTAEPSAASRTSATRSCAQSYGSNRSVTRPPRPRVRRAAHSPLWSPDPGPRNIERRGFLSRMPGSRPPWASSRAIAATLSRCWPLTSGDRSLAEYPPSRINHSTVAWRPSRRSRAGHGDRHPACAARRT